MTFSASLLTACLLLNLLALHSVARSLGRHSRSASSSTSSSSSDTTVHVVKLAATDDVTISQRHNLNGDDYVAVGNMPLQTTIARALLKFQPIPEYCKYVAKAELFTYYYRAHLWLEFLKEDLHFDPTTIHVRQVLSDWNEVDATLTYRKGGEKWNKQGLDLNNTDAAKEPVEESATIFKTLNKGYIKFDITSIAQNWVIGDQNYGVLLTLAEEEKQGREIHLYSHEAANVEGMEVKPYLKVTCWSDFCAPHSLRRGGQTAAAGEQETSTEESTPETREERSSGVKNEKIISSGGSTLTIPANSYKR